LREYEIDISCFRLRPYQIGDHYVLQRERLIPPPELDDFMVDTKLHAARGVAGLTGITRAKSVKPVRMTWGQGEEQVALDVRSWKEFLEKCVSKALEMGLPVAKLAMKKRTANGEFADFGAEYDRTIYFEAAQLHIDCNAAAETIKRWVAAIRKELGRPVGFVSVETRDGERVEL